MEGSITYPMTLEYVPDWSAWEVVREFVTNALDADNGFRMGLGDGRLLWIESKGYLIERHLLFGVSEKDGANAIGQFGEGMKLALLALTRMGLQANIYSGGNRYWNGPAEMSGEQVFKVCWEEDLSRSLVETYVEIPRWNYETYEERFVRPGDPRIVYTDPFSRMVLEEQPPNLYVKGIWVQHGKAYGREYAFSYNLVDVEMNRDRGVVDSWSAGHEIAKLWSSVSDTELLVQFWQAVSDGLGEKGISMGHRLENLKAHRAAFKEVFGHHAVIHTDEIEAREAKHRGAKVLPEHTISPGMTQVAKELVGTDADYVRELEGKSKILVSRSKLSDTQTRNLKLAGRLAGRASFSGKILPYILPPKVAAEATGSSEIRLSVNVLKSTESTVVCLLHELGHTQAASAQDLTEEHVLGVACAATKIILSYATRG